MKKFKILRQKSVERTESTSIIRYNLRKYFLKRTNEKSAHCL